MNKLLGYITLALILVSCGNSGGQFRLEGHFKNLNQGEFYLYNLDEGTVDTIMAKDGRFVYASMVSDTVIFSLLFPNFSEVPIFATKGATVEINGDVSHLKETEISGTKDNELMTSFRLRTSDMMPPEVVSEAERLILDKPASPVAVYLLRRYFLMSGATDYAKSFELCDSLLKAQPTNIPLVRIHQQLKNLRNQRSSGRLPRFKAVSTKGDTITNRQLNATVNVVYLWASWDYDSQNTLRQIRQLQRDNRNKLSVVTICVDATPAEGRSTLERDSITWPNICDGELWQSPLLAKFGMTTVGDNIVTDKTGNIVGRNLSGQDLRAKIEDLLK